jgi:3-phenylpropionate/trans-cinnamate dioxygenase ferredoxin subunit
MTADGAVRFVAVGAAAMKSGERCVFEIEGRTVLLLKIGNELFAVSNRCTHLDYPLDTGRLIGCELMCRKHGARFDLRTGRALGGPAVRRLEIYPTRINGADIEIGIPQAAQDGSVNQRTTSNF